MEGASRKATERNLPEEQARKILNDIRSLGGESAIRFRSLEVYARDWLSSKKVTASPGTFVRYEGIVNEFLAHAGEQRSKSSIETVTAHEVKAFRDAQLREGKSHTTANLALKTLRGMFNDARREGLISVNPAEAVKTFSVEKEARDVFSHDQLCELIKIAEPEWRTAILLAYYSGLRLSDAVGLSWVNVDFDRHEIRYFPRKTSHGIARQPDWKKHVNGQLEVP